MSDNQHIEQAANSTSVTQTQPAVIEQHPLAVQPNPAQPIVIERKGGRGMATGALVLSVLALGASGFLFVEGQNVLKQQENSVQNALDKAALGESNNGQKLELALAQQAELNQSVANLSRDQNQDHQHLANVQRSYNELLRGRVNWLVDEIEVTLNVASQQLLLSGNVPVAISALNTIEQRLKRFDQPELIPIKKAIADDLHDLKAQGSNYLDVSSTSLKVDGLEKGVASLPLLVDSNLQPVKNEAAPTANDVDFWTRTWDKTVGMLKGMVEIRKLASNDAMLLAPEQMYFVRANLRLRLLDARLALLQHNNAVYKKNLDEVKMTVSQYFDTQSPTTQEWLQTLNELSSQNLQIVSDTALSRSQTAVRNYQTQAETDKQPISLNEVEARSNVVLPALAAADKKAAETPKVAEKAVQAASEPVAASKVAEVAPVAAEPKPEAKPEPKPEAKPETKTEPAKTEAASGVSVSTAATTAAAAGLAASPLVKALSEQKADNQNAPKADSKPAEKKPEPKTEKKTDNKTNAKPADKAKSKPQNTEKRKDNATSTAKRDNR